MKILSVLFTVFLLSASLSASEIVKIKLFDGEILTGKLEIPSNPAKIKQLVIFIHGTGPGTYQDHRKIGNEEFNYFDLFASEFNKRGIAFFSYNKRGVEIGDSPPFYDKVDKEKFKKVVPGIEVQDIGSVIKFLTRDKRLKQSKVALLGWSEGTVLAAMAAENKKNKIAALFLAGYVNDNLFDVIEWQYSGVSSMVMIGRFFDMNKDNSISREEYESAEKTPTQVRTGRFKNAKFEQLDVNKDASLNSEDFKLLSSGRYKEILDAIEKNDDDWIWKNYFRVTTAWLKEHFKLEANKTRLLRLNIPIYIFHGEDDANTPAKGVYEIKSAFDKLKKNNLQYFVFERHNHDLNYLDYPLKKSIPAGIQKIFEISETLNK